MICKPKYQFANMIKTNNFVVQKLIPAETASIDRFENAALGRFVYSQIVLIK